MVMFHSFLYVYQRVYQTVSPQHFLGIAYPDAGRNGLAAGLVRWGNWPPVHVAMGNPEFPGEFPITGGLVRWENHL